jgi:hypothetical protein
VLSCPFGTEKSGCRYNRYSTPSCPVRSLIGKPVNVLTDLVEPINKIIGYCGYELKINEQGEYIVTGEGLIPDEETRIQTSFEGIQRYILEHLDRAQFTIWVSVAWFTDPVLFEKLKEKAAQGVNVQLVIIERMVLVLFKITYTTRNFVLSI